MIRGNLTSKLDDIYDGLVELREILRMFDNANFILTNEYENEDTICIKVGDEIENE